MDQDVLVNDRIAAGEAVVRALDAGEYPLAAAFWNYFSDLSGWRLVVVPRDFAGGAVKDELLRIRRTLKAQGVNFDLSDVKVSSVENPLVKALSVLVRGEGAAGIRAQQNWINGVYIEDAYIYRMAL